MATDPVMIVKAVGKLRGKRVLKANSFDANVCASPWDHERPWQILALPGDIFRHKLTLNIGSRRVTMFANGEFISAKIAGDCEVDVCSINRRDKIMALGLVEARVPGFEYLPVYAGKTQVSLDRLLHSVALVEALKGFDLAEAESVHFYRNGIVLYLQRDSPDELLSTVEMACKLADRLDLKVPQSGIAPD
jgi:hypothetical protein